MRADRLASPALHSLLPPLLAALMLLAVALPWNLAASLTPSPTALNQFAAFTAWALVLLVPVVPLARRRWPPLAALAGAPLALALAGLAAGVAISWTQALPGGIALAALAMLGTAAALALAGWASPRWVLTDAFWPALLVAALLCAAVSAVQVFAPGWADGRWLAASGLPGRAVGNLRQPNHLGTALLLGLAALAALAQQGRLWRWRLGTPAAWALGGVLVLAVLWSGSRTSALGLLLLTAWGVLDARLAPPVRRLLWALPLIYAVGWLAMEGWSHLSGAVFGAEARIQADLASGDFTASRAGVWRNTLALIAANPLAGVGFGEFNLAWTLSAFPGRPTAYFDHTHNLPLQLLVELGLPLGGLILGLLAWALWQAFARAWQVTDDQGGGALRAGCMALLLLALHSLTEYPLWYAYFLLPAAWLWGQVLGAGGDAGAANAAPTGAAQSARAAEPASAAAARAAWALPAAGALVLACTLHAAWGYVRVSAIYAPWSEPPPPLSARIATAQASPWFGYLADYAGATTTAQPPLAAFARTTHALLDTRLMVAWADAYAAAGDLPRARYLAARIAEFHREGAEAYFAPCATVDAAPRPYQCQAPEAVAQSLSWHDFLLRR